jgi:hypothetical protein
MPGYGDRIMVLTPAAVLGGGTSARSGVTIVSVVGRDSLE